MKSSIFNLTVALVVLTNVSDGSFHTRKGTNVSQDEVVKVSQNDIPTALLTDIYSLEQEKFPMKDVSNVLKQRTAVSTHLDKPVIGDNLNDFAMVERMPSMSIEEVIAQDNAITENQFSNETQALNFVAIENALPYENEKTIEEVITEDNAITENQFSNDTQALDFVTIENALPYENEKSIEEIMAEDNAITENQFPNEAHTFNLVVIENVLPYNNEKSIDEVIAEDNAITENQSSNEAQVLDFHLSQDSSYTEKIDNVVFSKSVKTIEEMIADDNLITAN